MYRGLCFKLFTVCPSTTISGHSDGNPVLLKKLEEGDGEWDVRKEILGWMFDGARRCIELPIKKLDTIISELNLILRMPATSYKRFERLVGRLRHAAIELPAGRRLCSPFNRTVAIQLVIVSLGEKGTVYGTLLDWTILLMNMHKRLAHVNELVSQKISDVGNTNASGISVRGYE